MYWKYLVLVPIKENVPKRLQRKLTLRRVTLAFPFCNFRCWKSYLKIRMHFSRMRTIDICLWCVPTTAVATIRCLYQGVFVGRRRGSLSRGSLCPEGVSVQRGVSYPPAPPRWTDRRFCKNYLPLLSVISIQTDRQTDKKCCIIYIICSSWCCIHKRYNDHTIQLCPQFTLHVYNHYHTDYLHLTSWVLFRPCDSQQPHNKKKPSKSNSTIFYLIICTTVNSIFS